MRLLISAGLSALMWSVGWLTAASGADAWTISNIDSVPGTISFTISGTPGAAIPDSDSVAVTADGEALKSEVTQDQPSSDDASGRRVAYLVLDVSGSMAGDRIAAARAAAADYAHAIPNDVELGVITFSDTVRTAVAATTDHTRALAAINAVRVEGDTALYDAVRTAVDEAAKVAGADERRLLVLSDGADTSSETSLAQAAKRLKDSSVRADVVAFGVEDRRALDQLSAASNGRTLTAENAEKLADAFRSAAETFAPRLHVRADIPESLAGKSATLVVSGVAGGEGWETTSPVELAALKAKHADPSVDTSVFTSSAWLLPLLVIVFAALLIVTLGLLDVPVRVRKRAAASSRLADAGRYRLGAAALWNRELPSSAKAEVTPSAISQRALDLMDKRLRASGSRQKVRSDVEGAGLRMRPEEWAVLQLCAILVAAASLAALAGTVLLVPVGALVGWLGCRLFLSFRRKRREAAFLSQLPDTLQLLTGSLRAGFSLNQALGTVVREGTEPTASEFNRTLTESRLGAPLEDALDDTADRMNCTDLAWVVIAVRISREVGGNLAEVMQTTVSTMRERAELRGLVSVLSAEGRMSAWVLGSLPFLVGGFMAVVNPEYFAPMIETAIGWAILGAALLTLSVGVFWLSRLVKIEV